MVTLVHILNNALIYTELFHQLLIRVNIILSHTPSSFFVVNFLTFYCSKGYYSAWASSQVG
jgi:hypothetical protein